MWGLIGIFAIDDILDWIHTPLIFYPIVLLIGIYLALQSFGLVPIVFPLLKQTANFML